MSIHSEFTVHNLAARNDNRNIKGTNIKGTNMKCMADMTQLKRKEKHQSPVVFVADI